MAESLNLAAWERLASVAGGAALLANGLRRHSAVGTMLAAGGALLIERGLTGHCAVYDALGVDTRRLVDEVEDHVPPHDVVDMASDDSFPASDPPSWTPHTAGSPAGAR